MSNSSPKSPLKKAPLVLAFGLALAALALTAGARLAGVSPEQRLAGADVLQSRTLRFEARPDGGVNIFDAATGERVTTAPPGLEGFLKGALRGLDRIRKADEVATDLPYRVEKLANGQLLLIDTASGLALDLNAYGRSNAAIFDAFLATTGENS
jgi:putative photosynthetic complex assembly protein